MILGCHMINDVDLSKFLCVSQPCSNVLCDEEEPQLVEDVDTEDITVGNVLIMAVPFLGQGNHLLKDQANHHKIRILVEGKSSFW
ncbi:unnamed protein product, partial [Brassica rapa]